jgi:hypothetical protein
MRKSGQRHTNYKPSDRFRQFTLRYSRQYKSLKKQNEEWDEWLSRPVALRSTSNSTARHAHGSGLLRFFIGGREETFEDSQRLTILSDTTLFEYLV